VEAGSFYTGAAGPLDQGDLLVAPLLRPINPAEPAPVDNFSRTPWLQIDETVSLKGVPPHDVLAAVQAAIVVSHGCHIDKQYNQRVDDLHRKQGLPLAEARRQAEADRTLDRWIAVSPVVPLDAVSADETAIAQRKAIGLFHIPAHPDGIVAVPAVADLSVKFTVDRTLTRRVSCLTAEARDELRMALMRVDLARSGEPPKPLADLA
jgi:hypothetical protein